jgi:glyoxylase-like metal-dependent hydrolase (beta-lactamase superfamily II)
MQGELHPNIQSLSFLWEKTNSKIEAYLLLGQVNAVIDTGPPQISADTIASVLSPTGLKARDIALILHTHGHLDHTGGTALIKAASGALIHLHKDDALFLEDHHQCFSRFNAPLIRALGREEHLETEKAVFLKEAKAEMVVDRKLQDNDLIDLGKGIELRVIHLSGHTPGSVGFYWEKEGTLFAGDSVSGLHSPGGSLPIIYDFIAYQKSIERLLGMDIGSLFCSHPYRGIHLPSSPIRRGREVREFLYDSRESARRIVESVGRRASETGERSLPEITDKVIAELPEEMGFKPIAELRSSLFSVRTVFWCLSQIRSSRQ